MKELDFSTNVIASDNEAIWCRLLQPLNRNLCFAMTESGGFVIASANEAISEKRFKSVSDVAERVLH